MVRKILVIDDSKTFRRYASVAFSLEWPDAEVCEYDPMEKGRPPDDFPWAEFDVLLLDYNLGLADETGLHWLAEFVGIPDLPITIMLTGEGSEQIAVQAMKLGANDYVTKNDKSFGRVIGTIKQAIEFRLRKQQIAHDEGSEDQPHPKVLTFEEAIRAKQGNWPVRHDRRDLTVTLEPEELAAVRGAQASRTKPPTDRTDRGAELPPGYRFIEELGQKSLSVVVLARRDEDDKPVVLKVISTVEVGEDPASFKRFIQEYTLIAHVRHPHIVRIHEQNFSLDHAFIAMEYFPRGNLVDRIKRGIPKAEAMVYLREMCYGLRAVHEQSIIHRDLKPSNILFRQDGSLAITDFGIAKLLRGRQNLTLDGVVIGTPNYMSPEQATGEEADQRSDLYSLGVIFYQVLTGRLPFVADDVVGLLYAHVHRQPEPLDQEIAEFQPIIDSLLAKQPSQRYASVDELLEALGDLMG